MPRSLKQIVCEVDAKQKAATKPVYRLSRPTQGVNFRRWLEAPDSVAHDDVQNIFTGPRDPDTGMPTHPNTPTSDGVEPDFNYGGPEDQQEMWSWVTFDTPMWIRDNNGNTGERGGFWIGQCGSAPVLQPGSYKGSNTLSADRGLMDATLVPAGTHLIYGALSDLSANGGFDLEQSANGVDGWANIPATAFWAEPREVVCEMIPWCDAPNAAEGWSECYPEPCTPVLGPAADSAPPALSALAPIADNRADTDLRVADAGSTGEFADAGHKHPIRVQANPGDPQFTFTGEGELTQQVILDRWPTEESYKYAVRLRVTQDVGTGWGWVNVPTIAGFRQPVISAIGTYRTSSTAVQEDNGDNQGASPRGPFMGAEAHQWSSTRRVYLGYFRRDDNAFNGYLEFHVEYIRN